MKNTRKSNRNTKKNTQLRCPYCGSLADLRSADGIYHDNSSNTMLYVCRRYPACDSYVRMDPYTRKPFGSMANGELRALRLKAHRSFDRLHKSGLMTRSDAYRWLAAHFNLPMAEAHIGLMGDYRCKQVIEACDRYMKEGHPRQMHPKQLGGVAV